MITIIIIVIVIINHQFWFLLKWSNSLSNLHQNVTIGGAT